MLPWSRTFMAARGIPVSPTKVRLECKCPHLVDESCAIWKDRPLVCRAFKVGGAACQDVRARRRPWLEGP